MKKLFGQIFIATIILGGIAVPLQKAEAEVYCKGGRGNAPEYIKPVPDEKACTDRGGTVVPEPPGLTDKIVGAAVKEVSAGLVDAFSIIPATIATLALQVVNLFVWLAGAILNFSVQYSIVDFAKNTSNAGVVTTPWGILRDLANMALIFMLLYAGIRTILGQESGQKKIVVNVVVIAVLINFSMFFTRVIIDTSNIVAITFYDAAAPGSLNSTVSRGISEAMMAPLGLQNIFNITGGLNPSKVLIASVMGIIFGLIAAFVFAAIALFLIIRFVLLIIVIIFSPVAFAGMILPQAEKYTKQWWDTLLGQAFFAPIYFLMAWVVIVVSNGMTAGRTGSFSKAIFGESAGNSGAITPPAPSDVGVIVNFVIVITLLIASLIIAKEWANRAAGGVSKLTGWATGAAGAATLGLAGKAGRNTLGRAGQMLSESEYLKEKREKGGFASSYAARLALARGKKMGGASFDVRGSGIGGMLDGGKAQKGGYAKDLKDKQKEEAEFANSLGPTEKEKEAAKEMRKYLENNPEAHSFIDPRFEEQYVKDKSKKEAEANKIDAEIATRDAALRKRMADGTISKNEEYDTRKSIDRLREKSKAARSSVATRDGYIDSIIGVDKEEAGKRSKAANERATAEKKTAEATKTKNESASAQTRDKSKEEAEREKGELLEASKARRDEKLASDEVIAEEKKLLEQIAQLEGEIARQQKEAADAQVIGLRGGPERGPEVDIYRQDAIQKTQSSLSFAKVNLENIQRRAAERRGEIEKEFSEDTKDAEALHETRMAEIEREHTSRTGAADTAHKIATLQIDERKSSELKRAEKKGDKGETRKRTYAEKIERESAGSVVGGAFEQVADSMELASPKVIRHAASTTRAIGQFFSHQNRAVASEIRKGKSAEKKAMEAMTKVIEENAPKADAAPAGDEPKTPPAGES